MYDYSTSQPYQPPSQANASLQPAHILEVTKLPEGIKPYEADTLLFDVKKHGATIKWLDASTVIAIFKTAAAAKEALQKVSNAMFVLKPWVAPVAKEPPPPPPQQTYVYAPNDPNDPWNE
jgi:hypothetical protein